MAINSWFSPVVLLHLATAAQAQHVSKKEWGVRYYVYTDPVFNPPFYPGCATQRIVIDQPTEHLQGDGDVVPISYMDVQPYLDVELLRHPWRVDNPTDADLFVIPFNLERSFAMKSCAGKNNNDRVEEMLRALLQSPWYQRKGGADHFWAVLHFYYHFSFISSFFPENRRPLVRNFIMGRYLQYYTHHERIPRYLVGEETDFVSHLPAQDNFKWLNNSDAHLWRCTVQMPILTPRNLRVEEGFEDWLRRPIFAYYRGKGRMCQDYQSLRNATEVLADVLPDSIISNDHASSSTEYFREIKSAKFCLVFGCDDPQTSRFYDAVVAGCIPVIIDDAFRILVAPFSSFLNYDSFTLTVPEAAWNLNPLLAIRGMYGWHQGKFRSLHAGLMAAQQHLSWHDPANTIWDMTLRTIGRECLHWQLDEDAPKVASAPFPAAAAAMAQQQQRVKRAGMYRNATEPGIKSENLN